MKKFVLGPTEIRNKFHSFDIQCILNQSVFFFENHKFKVKITFNDKHQIELETEEFVRSSRQWTIHPKYDNSIGNNYDLCLVQLDQPLDLITGKFSNIPI